MHKVLDRPRTFETEALARIAELEKALKHAQEALFWHDGCGFEMDGEIAGDVIKSALRQP